MTGTLADSSGATKAGNLPDLMPLSTWRLQTLAIKWNLPAPTAHPRTDKQRSRTIPLLSPLVHSYTGWPWNQNTGWQLYSMRSTSTTIAYTLVLVLGGPAQNLPKFQIPCLIPKSVQTCSIYSADGDSKVSIKNDPFMTNGCPIVAPAEVTSD